MKITKATEIKNNDSCYLIYGNPGFGKTSTAKYLPGKTIVINIDKSAKVLRGNENIDIADIDTHKIWGEWLDTVKELLNGAANDYDNIVIDNVSELFRACLANLGREGKNHRVPSQADYQRVDFTILDSLRALLQLNKRIVFLAWETSDQWTDENGMIYNRVMPDIRTKILNNFLGLTDVVARLVKKTTDDGEEVRGFILQPSASVYAKNRLDDRKGCKVEELFETT
ncbi:AAA family ATPase [Streptococcus pyogenes]|uniref:AAA family ATPase n=1 Tax=Streptococcus pyogenes TaxID=1314 RepID=UPI00116EBCF8|nr:AAA family ATPase [Streptococcus pyogenes]TNY42126.1 AAA family ATPase [Streptococcus pyogenes]HEP1425360.1 AAA family ATPase [Streptococcus pyogenes]HEQ7718265.1 AAA family ATPase [Streptococcus pyogenes]HER2965384.1 AAA family ATPase [Streptococcus pyogenes]HER5749980.1 AAA family ATPase [Streptococcus pyogenes]